MSIQSVITQSGDAVYREEDRVIIGTPDPEPTHLVGRSPGPVWHEYDEEIDGEHERKGMTL